MPGPTTLFVTNNTTSDEVLTRMAQTAGSAHLSCLLLAAIPSLPIYVYGAPPFGVTEIPDNWTVELNNARLAQNDRAHQMQTILADTGVSGNVDTMLCALADLKHNVARHAWVCDKAIIADSLRTSADLFRGVVEGLLFHASVGLVLNAPDAAQPRRIFVAWDNSATVARALHVALPDLRAADEVVIACFDPVMSRERDGPDPGADVAAWLSHHGCHITLSHYPSGGIEIGTCIMDRAREFGADLIVMGAYGHARLREAIFGGTTRTLLDQTELPVLMVH